ncbi:MAG: DNA-binding protein [Bacteroidetes bacterium]|nr:DNA-binding protein [Bacteroidota bacterium]
MLLRNKLVILFLLVGASCCAQLDTSLFRRPPASARPWVFWYWMQAAVSEEGIRADLRAMKEAGIAGAYLMPIQGAADSPIWSPPVPQLSKRWFEMVRYAMQEADSLGLQMALHDCDGFALAGGPWIKPERSMQKVVSSRAFVEGGRMVDMRLAQPETLEGYYKDITVVAVPVKAGWEATEKVVKESFKSDTACWIQYEFSQPFTCRSIVVHAVNNYQAQRMIVEVSDDGAVFRRVVRLESPRHGWQDGDAPVTHSIPTVKAKYYRFVYDKEGSEPGSEDLDAAKWKPSLKINSIELSAMPVIEGYEGKAGEVWRISKPSVLPDSLCVDAHRVVDLRKFMDAGGRLVWKAPAGHWMVLRMGHTSTGHTNATGGAAQGLECDKFDTAAIDLQFDRWFKEIERQVGLELAQRVLKVFHIDSWECGSQNWSRVFPEEFRRRRGYDLMRWMPVMAGVPLVSADSSERFLHDVRQTIAELVRDIFYERMGQLAHKSGYAFSAESVAPTMTSDGMLHYSKADLPMGEFWMRSPTHDKPNDMLDAISGAHVYGKPVVQAEAFTELRLSWDEHPGMLKALQDRNFALGINRMVLHVFTHNPWMDRRPGMTLGGVGNFFQRDQTWWSQSRAWMEYTARCQWLLQQGRPVADVAVFTGEELPRRAVLPERLVGILPGLVGAKRVRSEALRLENVGVPTTKVPSGVVHSANMADPADWVDPLHGYAFDSFNPDVLLRLATVRKGRIVLPGGASYALLVVPGAGPMVPDPGAMSVGVARKLLELVKAGATVVVDTTVKYRDPVVREIFRRLSSAKVLKGPFKESVLPGCPRDFEAGGASGIAYTHREGNGWDAYFISNQKEQGVSMSASVRVSGRVPEIWDPVTGKVREMDGWSVKEGRTHFLLTLGGSGSVFVVFRKPGVVAGVGERGLDVLKRLDGAWDVDFKGVGKVVFDSLKDWSFSADTAIRYYSGTAVYTKSFDFGSTGRPVYLLLGKVANIATVYVNGVECGTDWFGNGIEIGQAVRPGKNELRVVVTNTWANRLTGDQGLPVGQRRTWTSSTWKSDGKLLPAGLLGPVYLHY